MSAGPPDIQALFTAEQKKLHVQSQAIKAGDTVTAESVSTLEVQDANHDDTNAAVAGASINFSPELLELTKADRHRAEK